MIARTLLLAVSLVGPALAGKNDIVIDLGRGPVTVHVPDAYDPAEPAPLILLLHGYGQTGMAVEDMVKLLPLVEPYGFLYAYPEGITNPDGKPFWNGTDACCDFWDSGVDDSGYLRAFIEEVQLQLTVDDRRVYVVGHSNGGFMSYRMACENADLVAAVVSHAGATYLDPSNCTPAEPVDVLQIHGTADRTVLYDGGTLYQDPYPGAFQTVATWAAYDGCSGVVDTSQSDLDLEASIRGAETTVLRFVDGCAPGGSAELWSIHGAGHHPEWTPEFPRLVVEWLYAHPKPGLDAERYCSPNAANSTGAPGVLQAAGSDALEHNDLTLTAEDLPPDQLGYFLASLDSGFVANAGGSDGNLCVGGDIARFVKQVGDSGASGSFSASIDLTHVPTHPPMGVVTGDTWHFQAWYRDGGSSNFTDALAILFR